MLFILTIIDLKLTTRDRKNQNNKTSWQINSHHMSLVYKQSKKNTTFHTQHPQSDISMTLESSVLAA